jgi:thiamine-phosphate pyrophosphorylase
LRAPGKPLLCYVTDRRTLPGVAPETSLAALAQKIQQVASAGVDWVQIREKDLTARELASLTREALRNTAKSSSGTARPVRILVNDRLDVALAEGAGGVHLGEKSLPVQEAKRLWRLSALQGSPAADFLFGVSCHSLEAARDAARSDADYIFFGPVFATPSKAEFGAPQGLQRLKQVCSEVTVPVIAIGGITRENASSCLQAGAAGLAAIRLLQDPDDAATVVMELRK